MRPIPLIMLTLAVLCASCAVGDNWAALSRPPDQDKLIAQELPSDCTVNAGTIHCPTDAERYAAQEAATARDIAAQEAAQDADARAATAKQDAQYRALARKKCPGGGVADAFYKLPDGTVIAALPGGKLCSETPTQAAHELSRQQASDLKSFARCEGSKLADKTISYFQGICLLTVDGCGATVSETCPQLPDLDPGY